MTYTIEKLIPSVNEIIKKYPINSKEKNQIKKDREEIENIIEGKDKRKLLIIGPCSAWPNKAVIEYAKEIKKINNKYSDKIKIIIRVYTQKPRTNLGWTGPANQANPFEKADIEEGIIYCRKMMIDIIKLGLPIADEALFTHKEGYFSDLLSWIAIGARSAEDQEHRIYASMINHPVGLKNPSSGNLNIAINSVIAAQNSHVFLLNGKQIKSSGNKHAHLVLRGGNGQSNIYLDNLLETEKKLNENNIQFPSTIIDASHDNSIDPNTGKKNPLKQPEVINRVLLHMKENPNLNKNIKGFMVESFIKTGNQNINNFKNINELDLNGLSITDACIGIEETKKLIENIHLNLP
ncbi:MAG: 3-deoxy-7-phosphoheptulonate synthase [Nanoarchaeota archaeon]|nr:3-deoxy-7-phosphoheptulonate synthase [Nanoarchaeota archaeon]